MSPELASWLPGLIATAAGVIGSFIAIVKLGGRKEEESPSETPLVDLEERAAHAIAQLRDLEEQKARLEPGMVAAERDRLENIAAEALRQRDRQLAHMRPTRRVTVPAGVRGIPPQLRGFLWGGVTVLTVVGLIMLAQSASSPRVEGGTMTGNSGGATEGGSMGGAAPNFQVDAEMQALAERLKTNENDVEALVRLAHKLLSVQALSEAHMLNERVLALAPQNVEAQVHRAVLREAVGDTEGALAELDALLAKEPKMAEGWFFRGMINMKNGKSEVAKESWQKFVAVAPDGPQKERIRGFLEGKGLQMPGR